MLGAWGRISSELLGTYEILTENCRWGDIDVESTLTGPSQCSLIDLLQEMHPVSPHPLLNVTYDEVVGNANVFASFAYMTDYFDLIDSLEEFFLDNSEFSEDTTFFWFALVVNNQWVAVSKSFEWWCTTFTNAIRQIGHTVLICTPWEDAEPLKRAWCLFEINCSQSLSILLSKKQKLNLIETLVSQYDQIMQALAKIDLSTADCWWPENTPGPTDKDRIFEVVDKTPGGFAAINANISSKMRTWLVSSCRKGVEKYKSTYGVMGDETLEVIHCLGRLLCDHGELAEGRELLVQTLRIKQTLFGDQDKRVMNTLFQVLCLQHAAGTIAGAVQLLQLVQTSYEVNLGLKHHLTREVIFKIGELHHQQGHLIQAQRVYEEALGIQIPVKEMSSVFDVLSKKVTPSAMLGEYLETGGENGFGSMLTEYLNFRQL